MWLYKSVKNFDKSYFYRVYISSNILVDRVVGHSILTSVGLTMYNYYLIRKQEVIY